MASPKNAKVRPADAVVNSLTKSGCEGDAMMGSLAFHAARLWEGIIRKRPELLCPPFQGSSPDGRADTTRKLYEQTNQSLIKVVEFEAHPKIAKVTTTIGYRKSFERQAGSDSGLRGKLEVEGSFESFYDRLEMLKSPSFEPNFPFAARMSILPTTSY